MDENRVRYLRLAGVGTMNSNSYSALLHDRPQPRQTQFKKAAGRDGEDFDGLAGETFGACTTDTTRCRISECVKKEIINNVMLFADIPVLAETAPLTWDSNLQRCGASGKLHVDV